MPLELFVFLGSFLEEIISPIPSFVVMIPAGAAAQVQDVGLWYLLPLGLLGGLGRVLASLILYFIADKAENWLFGSGQRLFGVTHRQLEGYGQRFSGRPRDFMVLFLLNAIPVIPTALLSFTCGFIKLKMRLFVSATFFGATVNAIFYMALGYAGLQAVGHLRQLETASQIAGAVLLLGLAVWLIYYLRKKKRRQ